MGSRRHRQRRGTWINDQRVTHVSLGATTTVRFGAVRDGVAAYITIALPQAAADGPPDDEGTAVFADEHTVMLSDQQRTHIYGHGQSQADHSIDGLLIRTRDGDKSVSTRTNRYGSAATHDRTSSPTTPPCRATTRTSADDPTAVVRRPLQLRVVHRRRTRQGEEVHRADGGATRPPGRRISAHAGAGGRRRIGSEGDRRKRRRRTVNALGAAAAVVAVVGGGVAATVLLTGGTTHDDTLSAANLARAKRASVQIIALDASGLPEWTGSGTGHRLQGD